ncbi:MAG: hypothetical protein V7785_07735 [Bermanella sp.]
MDKKIGLDLANQHYYIQISSSAHTSIFSSVFAMDYLLQLLQKQESIELYGYCFFPDKIHLLVLSKTQPSNWLEFLLVQYSQWHQEISSDSGYVFDDENCQLVLVQPKFLRRTLHHVHNLPVTNKLCSTCDQYLYSSYHDYLDNQDTGINTNPILTLLSPHSAQRVRRFHDYMAGNKSGNDKKIEQGNHDYYLAYADTAYLTRAMSSYHQPYSQDIEKHLKSLWQKCVLTLTEITQLESNTVLGISRHHSLPDAQFLLAWLFINVAQGPVYYASKCLAVDEATLQLKIKSITLHHPKSYLQHISLAWHESATPA